MGGGGGLTPLRDQRAELRPLQNLRYQGPESEYYLGCARGWRWAELSEYVNGSLPITSRWCPDHPRGARRPGPRRHDAALIEAFKDGGHARSGQLLRAGSKQSILLNAAAPRAFVRQMESTSRDLFASLAACGWGRTGCHRHNLALNALRSRAGAVPRWPFSHSAFGQLSRRSARGWSARRRGGGVVLPRRAAGRSPQQRAARPHLPGGAGQWRG